MKDKYENLKLELAAIFADCETVAQVWGERARLGEIVLRMSDERIEEIE